MLAALACCFFFRLPAMVSAVLMVPMLVDGFVQQLTSYESSNLKRVVTGFLFGYGLVMLFVLSAMAVFHLGVRFGFSLRT